MVITEQETLNPSCISGLEMPLNLYPAPPSFNPTLSSDHPSGLEDLVSLLLCAWEGTLLSWLLGCCHCCHFSFVNPTWEQHSGCQPHVVTEIQMKINQNKQFRADCISVILRIWWPHVETAAQNKTLHHCWVLSVSPDLTPPVTRNVFLDLNPSCLKTLKDFLQSIILSDIRQVVEGIHSMTFLIYAYAPISTVYINLKELYLKLENKMGTYKEFFFYI